MQSIKPSHFAQSVYLLDGKPFSLGNRNYLKEIYDGSHEEIMIMSGRQVEKSTTNAVQIANHTLLIPNFKALYVAPLTKQVSTFSKERLGRIYKHSQENVVRKTFTDRDCSDNVFHKEFTNGSVNYLEHCFELGDNTRGISTNGIFFDEVQDIHIDAIPVVKESQSHALESGAKVRLTQYTGTPKTFSNTIQQQWDRSSKNEWVVRCPHCGKPQVLGIKNMRPDKYVCLKCELEIGKEPIINGRWISSYPDRNFRGYRISQMMVPWISPEEMWGKYRGTGNVGGYSIAKFSNECLGRSYEDAAKPFTQSTLARIMANDLKLYNRAEGEFANKHIFMGVDWGGGEKSFTVVTISAINESGQLQLLYTHKYEGVEEQEIGYQKNDIFHLMHTFKVAYCIVDIGFGAEQYEWLKARFGDRVHACYYSFNLGKEYKFDKEKSIWVVNRSKLISKYVEAVKEMRVIWPGQDKAEYPYLVDHHLAEYSEYRISKNGKTEDLMYNHPEGAPDDGLHSCVYNYLASKLYKGASGGIKFGVAYGAR